MERVPFSREVKAVYQEGQSLASRSGMNHDTSHILIALFMIPSKARTLLSRTGLDPSVLVDGIRDLAADNSSQIEEVYNQAMVLAKRLNSPQVTTVHLLIALTKATKTRAYHLLQGSTVSIHLLRTEAMASLTEPGAASSLIRLGMETGEFSSPEPGQDKDGPYVHEEPESPPVNRKKDTPKGPYDLDPTEFPVLSGLGTNLMVEAINKRIDPVIGRDREINNIIDVLNKRRSNNPLLLGEPGVGKTALVEGLARRIVEHDPIAVSLQNKVIIAININDIIAGTAISGSLAQRLSDLRTEMAKAARRVIVFFDEIHLIFSAGVAEGGIGLANDLKGALARGEFTCIGATTFHEYKRSISSDPALNRRFEVIKVLEPTLEQADDIIRQMAVAYGDFHGVSFDNDALHWAVRLSVRFMPNSSLPDKALNLMDVAGAQARRTGRTQIRTQDIVDSVASITGLSHNLVSPDPTERFSGFEKGLHQHLPAAKEAVFQLSEVIRRNHTTRFSNSPLGVFAVHASVNKDIDILAGILAKSLFGSQEAVIQTDLSEYTEAHSVSTLIGAPPGYVGHEQPGMLARKATKTPFAVYVWRAIDLADKAVVKLIEEILQTGVITDRQGIRLHYTNTLHLLLLSDIAYEPIKRSAGFVDNPNETGEIAVKQVFGRVLSAHFLSVIDEFIDLPVPGPKQLRFLVQAALKKTAQEAGKSYGIKINIDTGLKDRLVSQIQPENYHNDLANIQSRIIRELVKLFVNDKVLNEVTLFMGENGDIDVFPGNKKNG